jgi:hypothetical protein
MKTYFLSYARADEAMALKFADDLIAAGVSVWVDQYDIRPSQHWDRAVEAAVRACEGMIVILSPRSVASPNVADEVSVAIDDKKALIPILIEPCVLPLRMTRMQFIDAVRDYDAALRRCLAAVSGDAAGRPARASVSPAADAGPLPAEVLADAERRLAGFMGPIAKVLVRQAAARVATQAELYTELARGLPTPAERESFLGWLTDPRTPRQVVTPRAPPPGAPPPAPAGASAFTPQMLEAITRALARQLGPIAAQLVTREQRLAHSPEDLRQRLAARIPTERDRAAFLKDAGAA